MKTSKIQVTERTIYPAVPLVLEQANSSGQIVYRGWTATLRPIGKNTGVEFDLDPKNNHLVQGQDMATIEPHIRACIDTYTGNVQYVQIPYPLALFEDQFAR